MKVSMNIMVLDAHKDTWFSAVSNVRTAAVWASWWEVTLESFNSGPEILYGAFLKCNNFTHDCDARLWLWLYSSEETSLLNAVCFVALLGAEKYQCKPLAHTICGGSGGSSRSGMVCVWGGAGWTFSSQIFRTPLLYGATVIHIFQWWDDIWE